MFDMVFEALFPLVILSVPACGAIYLAGLLFGKTETLAAVVRAFNVVKNGLLFFAQRTHRAALAFVSDEAIPAVGGRATAYDRMQHEFMFEIDRLDRRITRLADEFDATPHDEDVEAGLPF